METDIKETNYMGGSIAHSASQNQTSKYVTGNNGSTGHGFVAEDANALADFLSFKNVNKLGVSNIKDGADRIVNGVQIQTKYCKTAKATVEAAFNADGYRYKIKNGKPMKLEVPRDQYEEAIKIMRQKILEGKVRGVKNPDYAEKMIKKGILTYLQSTKIAQSGTVESLLYDAATGTVSSTISAGISTVVTYTAMKKRGATTKEALIEASKSGGLAACSTLITQILIGQTEKYIVKKATQSVMGSVLKESTKTMVTKAVVKGSIKGAVKSGTKAGSKGLITSLAKSSARTNIVTGTVTTVVTTAPDVYKACKGKITWKECGERATVNASSVVGGIATAATAVALMSNPVGWAATAVGLVAGIGGSIASEKAASKVLSIFKKKKK